MIRRPDSVPVTGPVLRYQPNVDGDSLYARFETDAGTLAFTVEGEEEQAHFGNLLGNLADLREAQAKLAEAGLDPGFVSPAQEGADEGVSAAYQLIRLKEMLNRGLLGEIEFMIERMRMIDGFKEQASAGAG